MNEGGGTSVGDSSGNGVNSIVPPPAGTFPAWVDGFPLPGDTTPPAAPQNLAASAGNGLITLDWTANAEGDLAGYNIYRSTSSVVPLTNPLNGATPVVGTTYTDYGLTNGTPYYYAITAEDSSGNESSGFAEANATPSVAAGAALDFDGLDDHVTFGPAPGLGVSEFTVETWFKRQGTGITTQTSGGAGGLASAVPLVTKGRGENDGSNVDMNYFLGIDTTNPSAPKLAADFEEGPGGPGPLGLNHSVIGSTTITSNIWHHAAVTYADSTWKLYLDGALDTTSIVAGNPTPRFDSIQHAALGSALISDGTPGGYFAGVIDEARVWNYARSQVEIATGMGGEITSTSGLVGRWGMNEATGGSVADSSGTGAGGTTINGPVWVAGAAFTPGNLPPSPPSVNDPQDGATGVSTSPTLDVSVSDPEDDPMTVSFFGREVTPPQAPEFTIVHIPDTQHYVDDAARHFQFGVQTEWIVDTEGTLNTEFVTHSGDIVEHIDQFDQEWIYADQYMRTIDDAGMKNNVAPGNHDLSSAGVADNFDQYFPQPLRYAQLVRELPRGRPRRPDQSPE